MDCRTCQPTLIDLLHGELATDAADAARAHLRECASCSAAYEALVAGQRFGRTLEMADPPAAVADRIMAFAEAHARTAQQQRASAAAPSAQGVWRPLLEFVSRFAMARQVGMVTISLLIVAVGLWSLPQLKGSQSGVPAVAAGGTVLNPDAEESAVPPAGVQPAERLGLKMDARAGRILSKDGQMLAAPEAPAAAPVPAQPSALAEAQYAEGPPAKKASPARALDDLDAPLDVEQKRRDVEAERAPPLRARAEGSRAAANDLTSLADAELASASATKRKASTAGGPPAAFPKDEYAAGEGVGAVAATPAPSGPAALAAARTLSAQRGCKTALPRFQQIVAANSGTQTAGEALIEIARCRAALGDPEQARVALQRALRIAPVAPQAREFLRSIDSQKVAAEPSAAP
jgi:tetratricopeptide (TPR) repeat protein